MVLLGFDTATPSTAVALRAADGTTIELRDDPAPGAHPGHATRLLAMTGELLARAGVGWGAVDRIAVGLGPGTFTGLRVGVATARGLAQSLGSELVGVSSLRALAAGAMKHGAGEDRPTPHTGVLAVLDARRGQAFLAAYLTPAPAGSSEGPVPLQDLSAAQVLSPPELEAFVEGLGPRAESGEGGWLAVGDGAIRFRDLLERTGASVPPDASAAHMVGAEAICALGAVGEPAGDAEDVEPQYGRRPDAEIAR
jgi:tRNA threonylcarbamoyladenosine biosynthesis protein TsaB